MEAAYIVVVVSLYHQEAPVNNRHMQNRSAPATSIQTLRTGWP